ncbi:MAG: rane protein [Gaiellales bacterium]|nr:rane protein [Gaiellales bacterium]
MAHTTREEQITPLPELDEPRVPDPTLATLTFRDYLAILVRAAKKANRDQISHLAQAVAYNAFLAIPSTLLLALGLFAAMADPGSVESLLTNMQGLVPDSVIDLVRDSLTNVVQNQQGGIMIAVGAALAVWSLIGAMQTVQWSLNMAYEREETRGFLRSRLVALAMAFFLLLAFALVVLLLILGPVISDWVGEQLGIPGAINWIWWIGQWPLLILGLLGAFAAVLYLGPDVEHRRFQFITPGAVFALFMWLAISGAFAVYANNFSSYNKAWGSLAAVIVTLTWLWLSALAILFGAEINAETERTRQLRQGESSGELDVPGKQ